MTCSGTASGVTRGLSQEGKALLKGPIGHRRGPSR